MSKLTLTGYFEGQQASEVGTEDYLTATFQGPVTAVLKTATIEVRPVHGAYFIAPLDHPHKGEGTITNEQAFASWRDQ